MRIYAIGDIHGHLDRLREAHALIEADCQRFGPAPNRVVHIGDLVDRGPDSRGVIEFLLEGKAAGRNWIVLKGNHDRLFARFVRTGEGRDSRLRAGMTWTDADMGGFETLRSYGIERRRLERGNRFLGRVQEAVPEEHLAFVESLPLYHREGHLLFVHAGIRPGVPIDEQDEDDLLWIRDEFLWDMREHEALVVHGHTPTDVPSHYGNRVNIDTGAGWGHDLVPVVFDDGACFALTRDGRQPVKPPGM